MIRVKNLSKSFNNKTIIKNISCQFERGKTSLIIGQTGSGKTHTILGNNTDNGFLYLLLHDVLDIRYNLSVSVVEIYNNKCYDTQLEVIINAWILTAGKLLFLVLFDYYGIKY